MKNKIVNTETLIKVGESYLKGFFLNASDDAKQSYIPIMKIFKEIIEECPPAEDIVKAKWGEWHLDPNDHKLVRCSVCGRAERIDEITNFCPGCGAEMVDMSDEDPEHGHWAHYVEDGTPIIKCSVCGCEHAKGIVGVTTHETDATCPDCGAIMDEVME